MLDPHRLRVFRSVIASGSVQAAADNLHLTSSAVSQHLSALQRETGLVLFEKAGRGIVATEAARILDAQSDDLMSQITRLDSVVADLREGRSGRLVIGYFASAGAAWMPALVKQLTAEMPDLTLELILTEDGSRGTRPDIDLAIQAPGAAPRPGYKRTDLLDDPFVVVLRRDHPLAGRRRIELSELRGETWVSNDLVRSVGHRIVVASCAAAGFTPRFAVQAQEHHTAMAFVAAGIGITIIPRLAATPLPPEVRRVALTGPEPVRHIVAQVHDTGTANPAADRAFALLTTLIGEGHGGHRRPALSTRWVET
ncbi:MAG: LysR family transcriptional regulator [Nostocoides sp.]